MRTQFRWIARIHVVYLKQVDPRASLMNPLPAEPPFGPQRKNVGLVLKIHHGRKDS